LGAAIEFLFQRGAVDVTAVCLIAAPRGIAAVRKMTQGHEVTVVVGALDEKLNERAYIVPGLGDAGDRLYGLVCAGPARPDPHRFPGRSPAGGHAGLFSTRTLCY